MLKWLKKVIYKKPVNPNIEFPCAYHTDREAVTLILSPRHQNLWVCEECRTRINEREKKARELIEKHRNEKG
jgi:hypothetical protein